MTHESFGCALASIPETSKAGIPKATIEQIAAVWDEEVSRILQRMVAIGQEQRGFVPDRGPAAYELVKIRFHLTPEVVKKHLSERNLRDVDPASERLALDAPLRQERIENTARIFAERIWIRLLDKWWKETVRLDIAEPPPTIRASKGLRPPTIQNHHSPKFANRYWADALGKIVVYSTKPEDAIEARIRDAGQWGFEERLYSQRLEMYLGGLESQAATAIRKVLEVIPLSTQERKQLITFLIAQWLRTPAFILTHMSGLKRIIHERGIAYGTDIASLRRAFESAFENDALYSMLYRTLDVRSWRILVAPDDEGFIKPDSSVVIAGRNTNIYYPITPKKCLHIGPDLAGEYSPVIPLNRQLTTEQLGRTNAILASFAFESAITSPQFDRAELRSIVGRWFGSSKPIREARRSSAFRYWGPLFES